MIGVVPCFLARGEKRLTMGSITKTDNPIDVVGNQALLDKIDRLRGLIVGAIVSLPQHVVFVGDWSSGKSSVLESLTCFLFLRAASLCTRCHSNHLPARSGAQCIDHYHSTAESQQRHQVKPAEILLLS